MYSQLETLQTEDLTCRMTSYCKKLVDLYKGDKKELEENCTSFQRLFKDYLDVRKGHSPHTWKNISPLPTDSLALYSSLLPVPAKQHKFLLDKLVVVKLNGGLGTTMGCIGPKSLITVRNDLTFLDIIILQIESLNNTYGCNVPLVLMNSFNTEKETNKLKEKYNKRVLIYSFLQSKYPRIEKETLLPLVIDPNDPDNSVWYPPGHGDFYLSFLRSGLCDKFLENGKEFVFISNIDNLGATVDTKILNFLINESNKSSTDAISCDFFMEVTSKTRSDIKGGTLVYNKGKLSLLEIAQVPTDHIEEFQSVSKFKYFNTNNIWVRLSAIKSIITNNELHIEVIFNNKTLENGVKIIQLESACGGAIKCFKGSKGIDVPRSRFLPVKTTSDLLILMSNLFSIDKFSGLLYMNPQRNFQTIPLVKLGSNYFCKMKEFLERFENIPNILELDHLTVSGDVNFGKNVILKGTVIIIANPGERIDIPMGSILENKVVSGNLRVLDH